MELGVGGVVILLILAVAGNEARAAEESGQLPSFSRKSFPAGFIFGAGSAAYQSEGAVREGGRGPSNWDTFIHNHPDLILNKDNADVATDFYHRYKEDVNIIKNIGVDAHRFSIAWPRILPNGSISGGVNREGIQFYNNVINELLSKGVQPFVTLFHWDTPQGLEDEYGGFLSPRIVDDFRDYVDICFKEFGDRVKHWVTLNEPWSFAQRGYSAGTFAPGRCSSFQGSHCTVGDSSREPYLVAHHELLAHAAAVKLYRDKYQASQKGKIGITLVTNYFYPFSKSKSDEDATARALDFMFGWFMEPLSDGDYPFSMRALVGDRLPTFTTVQSKMLKGSFDFIGLNYYTSNYANSISLLKGVNVSYDSDVRTSESGLRRGIPIGPAAGSDWLFIYPQGIRDLLLYVKNNYNNPAIYITENGVDELTKGTISLEEALKDDIRIRYHQGHLLSLNMAIKDGVDVRGYFVWSFIDDFEWDAGYTVRFGLIYCDRKNGLKRYLKNSALWYQKFLKG